MRELGFGFVLAGQGPAKYLTKFLQLMELSRKFLQMRHLTGCSRVCKKIRLSRELVKERIESDFLSSSGIYGGSGHP